MKYIYCKWIHRHPIEPVDLYSELDDGRFETRKVEVFRDGTMGFADSTRSAGTTRLGDAPVPSVQEIGASSEFMPREIEAAEFEAVWVRAIKSRQDEA